MSSKPPLLFLCQRLPYPLNKGEKIRAFHLLRYLAERFQLHVGTLVDDPDDAPHAGVVEAMVESLYVGRIDPRFAKAKAVAALLGGQPISFRVFAHKGLARWVDSVIAEVKPQAAVIYSSNMAPYLIDHPQRPKTVLMDFVDMDSEKFRAYAEDAGLVMRRIYGREARLVARWERDVAAKATWLSFVSAMEAALFKRHVPSAADKVLAVSNGVDTDFFSPDEAFARPFDVEGPVFVFTGAMDYQPNIEAVTLFAQWVMPKLAERGLRPAFYIVGGRPSADVKALGRLPGVHVTGRVDDVRPYLYHATAAVAPIQIARGIQNKVLEAMAMARPVVATPPALDGIELDRKAEVIEAADLDGIAAACEKLMAGQGDPDMGRRARGRVTADYSWPARLAALEPFLKGAGV